jgi:hypothetical protein
MPFVFTTAPVGELSLSGGGPVIDGFRASIAAAILPTLS